MKKLFNLIFLTFIVCITSVVFANAEVYMGSRPLGGDYDLAPASEGPTGSILVTTPGVSNAGSKSLGSGFAYIKLDNYSDHSKKLYQIPLSFSYTPIDKFDLTAAIPFIKLTDKSLSCSDLFLGVKYGHSLFESVDIKSAIAIGWNLPTGGNNYNPNNSSDLYFDFPMQKDLEIYTFNFNFGFGINDIGKKEVKDEYFKLGAAVSRALNKETGISLDFVYQDSDKSSNFLIGCGLKYLLTSKTSITFAFAGDIISSGPDYLVSFGLSQSF